MAFRERIEVIVDFVTTGAKTGLGKLTTDVKAADGVMGKFKAGAKGAFDMVGVYGPQAAMAAGAALVTFGAKAVNQYTDAALAAGKFADATGMSTEEASRLAEVAGDLGVDMGTLEGAVRRVNGAASTGALADFGIEIAKTKDGAYDATGTFLNTVEAIGKITSAADREVAAKKLMGKSWAELAELTTMSADEIRQAMAEVSDQQVFDDKKVAEAREYRAAMDDLKDAVERVTLATGSALTPVVSDLADAVGNLTDSLSSDGGGGAIGSVLDFVNPLDNVTGSLKEVTTGSLTFGEKVRALTSIIPGVGEALDRWTDKNTKLGGILGVVTDKAGEQTTATEDLTVATDDGTTSTAEYVSKIEALATALDEARQAEEDARNARKSLADLNIEIADKTDAYQDSLAELGGTLLDTESTTEDVETAQRNARDAAIDLAETYAEQKIASGDARDSNTLMIESLGYMAATLEPNSPLRKQLEAYIEDLRGIPTNITTTVSINQEGTVSFGNGGNDARRLPIGQTQADTGLWAQGMAARAAQPSAADRKRQAFDREMEILKRKYEVGDITADEYLNALTRLGQKYKWKRLSDPWMALWREKQQARKDAREAAAEAAAADQDGDLAKAPGKGVDGDGPAIAKTPKMGAAPRMGGRSGSGAGVVINAIVMNRKDVERLASELDPILARVSARRERGES